MNTATEKIKNMQVQDYQLDGEEREILHAIEREDVTPIPMTTKERKKVQQIAKNTLTMRKNKAISIRISEQDLQAIRAKAAEQGMPYQTLITSVLHRYVHGTL